MVQNQMDPMVHILEESTYNIVRHLKNENPGILALLYGPLSQKVLNLRLEEPNRDLKTVILKANMSSGAAIEQALLLLDQIDLENKIASNHSTIQFRRISRSRIQASCDINGLSFIWESLSISNNHDWNLRRISFSNSDDEEYYWRPWQSSLAEAETEYSEYKLNGGNLERPDILDTDLAWIRSASTSSASSSINSDDLADVISANHLRDPVFKTWKPQSHTQAKFTAYELRDDPSVDYWDRYGLEYDDC
jgi:hypothetical protein